MVQLSSSLHADFWMPGPDLSPNHLLPVDNVPTFITFWPGGGHVSLIAPGAVVGVEQKFARLAHRRAAVRARWVLELEIPDLPTTRAAVMGHDLNPLLNDITLQTGVTPGPRRSLARKGRKARAQERERALSIFVEDLDADGQGR